MTESYVPKLRHLIVILGDQLDDNASAFDDFDKNNDAILMMEVSEEASYVPQHKLRLVLFFSAMRHFRDMLRDKGMKVYYVELEDRNNRGSFAEEIPRWINKARPEKIILTKPGDYRVEEVITKATHSLNCPLEIRTDRHFFCHPDEFRAHIEGRKTLRLEYFYREMRENHRILVEGSDPVGGKWNYDQDNRESFDADGPGHIKAPRSFRQDELTKEVINMVNHHFTDSPGSFDEFDYPVTRQQARDALRDFIQYRLACFGTYQDAMVTDYPYLYHSRLSCMLNLHILNPEETVNAVVSAYEDGSAPLNAVEGFVRQVLGWREYIRGIYWLKMPDYAQMNVLKAELPVPAFMWTGETDMNCIRQSVLQLIDHAYAHHIQRLMVLGLFTMLLGVRPYDVHRWHLSMYADAIDWVSLPNVLGMSQYGDGGIVGSKPYAASGNYINKMSDYCKACRYNPKKFTGDDACPITTLYWDFLSRHRQRLTGNRRMAFQLRNLDCKDDSERRDIYQQADSLKTKLTAKTYL